MFSVRVPDREKKCDIVSDVNVKAHEGHQPMTLQTNMQRKIKTLEKELTHQLSRAASVTASGVGLVGLIEDALSTAKTLSTLREIMALSGEEGYSLPTGMDGQAVATRLPETVIEDATVETDQPAPVNGTSPTPEPEEPGYTPSRTWAGTLSPDPDPTPVTNFDEIYEKYGLTDRATDTDYAPSASTTTSAGSGSDYIGLSQLRFH